MLRDLVKFRVFALEMLIGLLIGGVGLALLLKFAAVRFTDDNELLEKVAAALVTIGGTVLISGIFRFAFSVRLWGTEQRILDALVLARHELVRTISNFQPKGSSPRPMKQCADYRYLYWRTREDSGKAMWLHFRPLAWGTPVLPFFEAHGDIDSDRFGESFQYYLAMVQLQNCLAISATRINPDGTPFGEMAGVYVFAIPVGTPTRLYGFLRHVNMEGSQSLSSCILSTVPVAEDQLDRVWLAGSGKARVDRNFPVGDEVTAQTAVA